MTTLAFDSKLGVKKSAKNAPHLIIFADSDGKILGGFDNDTNLERAANLISAANFSGALGETVSDYALADKASAISVIGVGKLGKLANNIAKVAAAAFKAGKNSKNVVILWGDVLCQQHFGQFALAFLNAGYRFDTYKSEKTKTTLSTATIISTKDTAADYERALAHAQATFIGQSLTRDVANEAPNVMNPSELAKVAKQLGKEYSDVVNVNVLGEKEMAKLGMGCFLAVSKGSDEEGKLVVIEYFGKSGKGKKAKLKNPIALVGKGITFDTGGISLKPAAGMDEMKYDMGGAAAMLGTIKAVCEARLALDVVVVLACAENMPSGKASRPGDIVTAMNGMSVEILNTDAEGRLVLCDALCYTQDNYKPATIIDAATLTGACVIALGGVRSGLYSNDEDTLFALQSAGEYSGDLVWQMPLDDAYDAQLKSTFADVQNIGGREAGSVTAACFLQRFIKENQAWAHLDIAGTAWQSGENKGASGRPVPMLVQYLANQVSN
ncbi:leucyl aminopeptidase [Moraxella caviae]|uniref:Probable cytosol aminopeptidase n=1 Tax=Moraxella caviae TaxID=34060 RepID=A0A1T0A188_9GAMM|nr:leucyl aminopeptidase [Moraxella caviae]OOR89418.1 leucyl aminopeptidase [Moraxella caviae]STZ09858.1 Cytosol aminopeptidase [Moraxella caviae]VEW13066.1 Cytosol aminopeptidase [Moraxella caviae]